MAKKVQLAADVIARLKAVGIKATTEDDARKKLLEALKKIGVEGMETENTNSLLDMVEGFGDDDETEEEEEGEEEEENEEEAENDALAEEVAEETENDSEEEETEEENEEEEEEEEEDEKPAVPAKKTAAKKTATAAKKTAEKPAKKEVKKAEPAGRKSSVLKPKTNDEDKAVFDELQDIFPTDGFAYDYIQSGVTIKNKGANSKRGVVSLSECKRTADGTVMCNLYFLTMGKKLEVLDENEIEYVVCWSGAPYVKNLTIAEAKELIKKFLDEIVTMVKKIDDKLGQNREKMMKDLKKNKTAPAPEPETKEEEEEEEEATEVEEKPKKKVAKAAPAKKVAKKKK